MKIKSISTLTYIYFNIPYKLFSYNTIDVVTPHLTPQWNS